MPIFAPMSADRTSTKPQDDEDKAEDKYMFVPGLGKSYTASVRAHVLRDNSTKRRAKARPNTKNRLHSHHEDLPSLDLGQNINDGPAAQYQHQIWLPSTLKELQCYPYMGCILGEGRLDPFSTYIRKVTFEEQSLIDHCTKHLYCLRLFSN